MRRVEGGWSGVRGIDGVLGVGRVAGRPHSCVCPSPWQVERVHPCWGHLSCLIYFCRSHCSPASLRQRASASGLVARARRR